MFCCFISRKFSNKCKHSVKCIKCRMETIRRKQQAMVRYLKKDVADLISSNYDANAFGRMDALIVEINKSCCYDMIEQYCCCILEHLPTMQKDRLCPEETTEAIATLIFAAARFSDLPELADLRRHFTARYGTHMDAYINEEFVEKLQKKKFSKDKKLQLMQYIAQEFSVHWDVKAFEYKISNSAAPTYYQPKIHISSNNEHNQQSHTFNGRREVIDGKNEVISGVKPVINKAENRGTAYQANRMQKQQINSDELINSKVVEEKKNTIQMERYADRFRSAVQKKVVSDELENIESYQLDKKVLINVKTKGNLSGNQPKDWICEGDVRKRSGSVREGLGLNSFESQGAVSMVSGDFEAVNITPCTQFTGNLQGNITNHDGFTLSTVKETDPCNVLVSRLNRRVNPESNKPFNLKPPYVKPKVVRSSSETGYFEPTNYEMSNDGATGYGAVHLKNAPFSVRRKHLEHHNLGEAGRKNGTCGDVNDQQISILRRSNQTEDDACMHRTFSDQPIHDCTQSQEEYITDNPSMHYSRKVRTRMRKPSAQSILDSVKEQQYPKLSSHTQTRTAAPFAELTCPDETMIQKHIHASSTQQGQLSSYGERVPSRLHDNDDLAIRLAALKKL